MEYQNILLEVNENIGLVHINRPNKLNALNKETIEELSSCLDTIEQDISVKVVILTGVGEKAFVAGADISEFAHFGIEQGTKLAAKGQEILFNKVENFSKPVIAAINGFALGGGLELAMSAHFRYASQSSRVGLPETSLGVIPGYGGTQRLSHLIGKGRAMEMIMTAKMIDAPTALSYGLVNKVVEGPLLIDECKSVAKAIMKNSTVAISSAIKAINASSKEGGFDVEIQEFGKCFGTEDFKEGTDAFLNKRKADFPGK
jgi:enoyl-CoA hydratase